MSQAGARNSTPTKALLQSLTYLQLLCCQVCAEHVIIATSTVQGQEATRRQSSTIPFVHPAAGTVDSRAR
jgi:hypothetical protein